MKSLDDKKVALMNQLVRPTKLTWIICVFSVILFYVIFYYTDFFQGILNTIIGGQHLGTALDGSREPEALGWTVIMFAYFSLSYFMSSIIAARCSRMT